MSFDIIDSSLVITIFTLLGIWLYGHMTKSFDGNEKNIETCKGCGRVIRPRAKFCPSCGKSV